ncbi:hypothetical protein EON66_04880 [archaeon]|nr:MAG: hypothetical protein EON66_04880 [archaeon]
MQTGSVYAVKVLGALGLVDGGETDWKILAVRTTDPIAQQVSGASHVPAPRQRFACSVGISRAPLHCR